MVKLTASLASQICHLSAEVWSTLLTNFLGCGFLAFITGLTSNTQRRIFLGTGFCGGATGGAPIHQLKDLNGIKGGTGLVEI